MYFIFTSSNLDLIDCKYGNFYTIWPLCTLLQLKEILVSMKEKIVISLALNRVIYSQSGILTRRVDFKGLLRENCAPNFLSGGLRPTNCTICTSFSTPTKFKFKY